jgi:dipeptidyl aminopeptidase/acylaminoacyl peptidase
MARVRAAGDRQVTRTLSPDRWEQIRTAFEEIVDLDRARRDRRLKTIGAKDPTLRLTLEALLQADAQANAWLAPVESPLGFVPPAADEVSAPPNAEDAPLWSVSLTRRRWLMIAVGGVALGAGGVVAVSAIARRTANTEADWQAPAAQPVIAASNYSLVGVNLRGEERPLVDIPSRNAGSWGPSALDTGYFAWPRISPDGKRIAVEMRTGDQRWDIWIYDRESRNLTRLTHDFTGVRPFGWSPDSRNLIYLAIDAGDIGGARRVVSQQWDGSALPRQLLQTSFPILDVTLGPWDGHAVIREMGNDDLSIASLRPPATVRPFIATSASEVDPRVSRDGQLLAYASNESGQFEVYVLPLSDPWRRVQVSHGGGTQPVWSPDGRQLFYRSPDRMMRATVRHAGRLTVERVEPLFADIYERHDVTNYDVLPGGEELVMIRARSR